MKASLSRPSRALRSSASQSLALATAQSSCSIPLQRVERVIFMLGARTSSIALIEFHR